MKEVTEWNGKPRYMWVWDDNENNKTKKYVVSILSEKETREANIYYPVMVVGYYYKHCAEIEDEPMKETRLTYYELCQLLKCFGVERYLKNASIHYIHNDMLYEYKGANKEVSTNIQIRYKGGEWEEPTRETVLKWTEEKVKPSELADIERFVSFIGWDKE